MIQNRITSLFEIIKVSRFIYSWILWYNNIRFWFQYIHWDSHQNPWYPDPIHQWHDIGQARGQLINGDQLSQYWIIYYQLSSMNSISWCITRKHSITKLYHSWWWLNIHIRLWPDNIPRKKCLRWEMEGRSDFDVREINHKNSS